MTAAAASFLSSARTWAIESPALKTTLNTMGLEGAANVARSALACAESTSALGVDSMGGYVVSRQPVPCAARREDNTATRMTAVRTASGRIDLGEGILPGCLSAEPPRDLARLTSPLSVYHKYAHAVGEVTLKHDL